jgi:hypothetical protein
MKHLIDIPDAICERYEPTGEFRGPRVGEDFVNSYGKCEISIYDINDPRIILRRKPTPLERLEELYRQWGSLEDGIRHYELYVELKGIIAALKAQEAK